jgi:predicted nuclease with TOPRIM domain
LKDKRQAESDLDSTRERLKDALKEKTDLENKLKVIQKNELARLNVLEKKFEEISD